MSVATRTARAAQSIARIFTPHGNSTPEGRALAYMYAESAPSTDVAIRTGGTGSSPSSTEVVVDWRMSLPEWEDLRRILLTRPWSPYIESLWHEGKLGPASGNLMTGTWHSDAERCAELEALIKIKEEQVADLQLELRDCHLQLRALQRGELCHNGRMISRLSRQP